MRILAAILVTLLVASSSAGVAQPVRDAVPVELAAARHVLSAYGDAPVLLDPAFAAPATAPGVRTTQLRDAAATSRLVQALGGRIAAQPEAGGTYLLLSRVVLDDSTAALTATVVVPARSAARRRSCYRTVQLHLSRGAGGWRVEREVELGIS